MPLAVKVVFRSGGKNYHFSPAGLDVKYGEDVIVNSEKGLEMAKVVSGLLEIDEENLVSPLKEIVRIATEKDKEKVRENEVAEEEYIRICKAKSKKLNLDMKVINSEMSFDCKNVTFHFTAEKRVDFRQLVKELNTELKAKVKLCQVGARDESKFIGGFGGCGHQLCCTQFICDFDPVSIKMAKEQNLPLNPNKISGACGRLMCCIKYENETYKEFKQRAPRRGQQVKTPDGIGVVSDYNVMKETVICKFETGANHEYELKNIQIV